MKKIRKKILGGTDLKVTDETALLYIEFKEGYLIQTLNAMIKIPIKNLINPKHSSHIYIICIKSSLSLPFIFFGVQIYKYTHIRKDIFFFW